MQVQGRQLTSTAAAAVLPVNCNHLVLSNDGVKTIYLIIEQGQGTPTTPTANAATTFPLAAGEVLQMDTEVTIRAVHYVCAGGESCVFRYLAWR